MRVGLLLPHFGNRDATHASLNRLPALEHAGLDSVWVRDHLIYAPEIPGDDGTWVDPFVMLAAVAARTSRMTLGTAVLMPHRHPLHLAGLISSLVWLAGAGRIIAAFGMGSRSAELSAAGLPEQGRGALLEEQIALVKELWLGEAVTRQGGRYPLSGVRTTSAPGTASTPLWYGGITDRAVMRAAAHFDGLLLSRLPSDVALARAASFRSLREAAGRGPGTVGVVIQASPGRTRAEAYDGIDIDAVMTASARFLKTEVSTTDGLLLAGTPGEIAEGLSRLREDGFEHCVLDLRSRFTAWDRCADLVLEALAEFRK